MMTESVQIKNLKDARERLEQLHIINKPIESLRNWPDERLSLKPVLDGKQIRVMVSRDDGASEEYQLWFYKRKMALLTPGQVNEIYEREVLDGILKPVKARTNPFTGRALVKVSTGEAWINEKNPEDVKNFNVKQVYVDFNVKMHTGTIVREQDWAGIQSTPTEKHLLQKWLFDEDKVPRIGETVDPGTRRGSHKNLTADDGARYRLQIVYGYDDKRVEILEAQAGKITTAFQQGPALEIIIPKNVLDQISPDILNKNPLATEAMQASIIEAAKYYAAGQVSGGPLGEPLAREFSRASAKGFNFKNNQASEITDFDGSALSETKSAKRGVAVQV
jgi:hypothetical protein